MQASTSPDGRSFPDRTGGQLVELTRPFSPNVTVTFFSAPPEGFCAALTDQDDAGRADDAVYHVLLLGEPDDRVDLPSAAQHLQGAELREQVQGHQQHPADRRMAQLREDRTEEGRPRPQTQGARGVLDRGAAVAPAVVAGGLILLGAWLSFEALSGGWRNAVADDARDELLHRFAHLAIRWQ